MTSDCRLNVTRTKPLSDKMKDQSPLPEKQEHIKHYFNYQIGILKYSFKSLKTVFAHLNRPK